jgi:hypothetical protein
VFADALQAQHGRGDVSQRHAAILMEPWGCGFALTSRPMSAQNPSPGPSPAPPPAPSPAPSTAPTHCLNCGQPLSVPRPKFCGACGQETRVRAPRLMEFAQQFGGAYLATEGALWRTLKLLLFKPGELTRQYLAGRRKHYVLPLRLYLTVSVLVLLGFLVCPE